MSKFDLVTHKRDRKGKIVNVNPYRLRVRGTSWLFERPVGSGNMYSLGGDLMEGPLLDERNKVEEKRIADAAAIEKLVADVKKEETVTVAPVVQKVEKKTQEIVTSSFKKGK